MTNRNKYLKRKYLINREIRDNYPEKKLGTGCFKYLHNFS